MSQVSPPTRERLLRPVYENIQRGDLQGLQRALMPECLPLLNTLDPRGYSPLHRAALAGRADMISLLLDQGANHALKGICEETPLHLAARKGHTVAVSTLLQRGADPALLDDWGHTALHNAAAHGHASVVRELLTREFNHNSYDRDGYSPLEDAIEKGYTEAVREFLNKGVALEQKNPDYGFTPLLLAVREGCVGVVELLLEYGAQHIGTVHGEIHPGRIPLHEAVAQGDVPMVECLLRHGANPSIKDGERKSAFDWIPEGESKERIHALLRNQMLGLREESKTD